VTWCCRMNKTHTITLQTIHNFFFSYGTSFGALLWSSVECCRMLIRNAFSWIASSFSLCLRSVSSCYTHKRLTVSHAPTWQKATESSQSSIDLVKTAVIVSAVKFLQFSHSHIYKHSNKPKTINLKVLTICMIYCLPTVAFSLAII